MDNATPSASAASPAPTDAAPAASVNADPTQLDVANVIGALLKSGEPPGEKVATFLLSNMTHLLKQGKLNQGQVLQLKQFADKHKAAAPAAATASQPPPAVATPKPTASSSSGIVTPNLAAFKAGHEAGTQGPSFQTTNPGEFYPTIRETLNSMNPGPVQWAQTRPTLTGGIASGRISGTPAQIARTPEDAILSLDDNRSRRKNSPGDQSMRRTIQDLVASVDPNVKIEPEVEDLLLSIADEFIDSVTNFSCRLAKHRGGDSLEVRDLQLHLERNHNIRIPGFASDETRISMSQTAIGPAVPATSGKKVTQGTHMTLRSQRLAQVAQAKREAKLM